MASQSLGIVENNAAGRAAAGPIDLAHLQKFTLGNSDLEREVLELFCAQAPLYLGQLRTAGTSRDWHRAAHTLKGSAAAVGASKVANLAASAEQLQNNPDRDRRAQAIEDLQEAVREAARHVAVLFPPQ